MANELDMLNDIADCKQESMEEERFLRRIYHAFFIEHKQTKAELLKKRFIYKFKWWHGDYW